MESVRMVLTESCEIFDWLTIAPSGQGNLIPVQIRCPSVTAGGKVSYAKMKLAVYSLDCSSRERREGESLPIYWGRTFTLVPSGNFPPVMTTTPCMTTPSISLGLGAGAAAVEADASRSNAGGFTY